MHDFIEKINTIVDKLINIKINILNCIYLIFKIRL